MNMCECADLGVAATIHVGKIDPVIRDVGIDGGAGTRSAREVAFVDIDGTGVNIGSRGIRYGRDFQIVSTLLHAAPAVAATVAAEAAIGNAIIPNLGPSRSPIGCSPDAVVGFAGGWTKAKHPHIHLAARARYGELGQIDRTTPQIRTSATLCPGHSRV